METSNLDSLCILFDTGFLNLFLSAAGGSLAGDNWIKHLSISIVGYYYR